MKVYFISGLGADSRVFNNISLPPGYEPVFLEWITPLKNESLREYALRLAEKINTNEPFSLIGLSMGGMIATEIAKEFTPAVIILLSSVPSSNQLPKRYKIAQALRLHLLIPVRLIKSATIMKRIFSVESNDDKQVLRQVIKDTDPAFVRWAMGAILEWKNETIPTSLFHIHGSRDEILPLKHTRATHTIIGGRHMMVMSKAAEINILLQQLLVTAEHPR